MNAQWWRSEVERQLASLEAAARQELAAVRAQTKLTPSALNAITPRARPSAREIRRRLLRTRHQSLEAALSQVAFARAQLARHPSAARGMYHALMAAAVRLVDPVITVRRQRARKVKQAALAALVDVNAEREQEAERRRAQCRAIARRIDNPTADLVRAEYKRRFPSNPTPSRRTVSRYLQGA